MTYMVNGKQYIVVAVSGGNYSGEYIAFSIPDDARTTNERKNMNHKGHEVHKGCSSS